MQERLSGHKIFFLLLVLSANRLLAQFNYPITKKVDTVDHYFNTSITDEYRWLESVNDSAVVEWVDAQNKHTDAYFLKVKFYSDIEENIRTKNGYYVRTPYSPTRGYSFEIFSDDGSTGRNPILYYKTKFEEWKELVDPLKLKHSPKENVRITGYYVSPGQKFVVFSISRNGSDWNEICVVDMHSKKITGDAIKWVKTGEIMWYRDGFFYERFREPSKVLEYLEQTTDFSLFYHRMPDKGASDIEIKIDQFQGAELFDDQLLIRSCKSNGRSLYNLISVLELKDGEIIGNPLKTFIIYPAKKRYNVNVIDLKKDSAVIKTNLHADKGMVAVYDTEVVNKFDTLVREYNAVLTQAFYFNKELNCIHEKDYNSIMTTFSKKGVPLKTHLFANFSSVSFYGIGKKSVLFFDESSFGQPKATSQFNFKSFTSSRVSTTYVYYTPSEYVTKLIEYSAPDGVKIPLLLFYKKGLNLNSTVPVLLNAYGGFGIISNPSYDFKNLLWVENGGIYAMAAIRGGGEKGRNWHFAGAGINKQTSINDFAAAAKFLIDQKFTSAEKLAAIGTSNGGLIVTSAAIQHPDLFKAVIAEVGVFDMLRYHKFTVGKNLIDEYGSSDDSTEVKYQRRYSPLHIVKDSVHYPAMLLTTQKYDDRVPPFHSYKLAAKLQNNGSTKNPVLLYVGGNSGHYGLESGTNKFKREAYELSFLFSQMGIEPRLIK